MRLTDKGAGVLASLTLLLTACSSLSEAPSEATSTSAPVNPSTTATPSTTPEPSAESAPGSSADRGAQDITGTVVRFSSGSATLDVTIGEDSPATRDFLSMLPLTLELEEFNGREKIAYLPRELEWVGSPGSDPEDGDLIYYAPWGNIGFYYNTDGIGYSDATLHLGTYDATEEELARFEGQPTTIEVVDP